MKLVFKVLIALGIVLVLLCGAFLFALKPASSDAGAADMFSMKNIGHRGFHKGMDYPCENSLASFVAAADEGYAIELDVHLTADNQVIVFHDYDLDRMTNGENTGIIKDMTLEELEDVRIGNDRQPIPTLQDVYDAIDGRAPIIVEIKKIQDYPTLCAEVYDIIKDYSGPTCIKSFDPDTVAWFKNNAPEVMRGLVSCSYSSEEDKEGMNPFQLFELRTMIVNLKCRPNFISYSVDDSKNSLSFKIMKALYHPYTMGWTIKSQEKYDEAAKTFDAFLFQNFSPNK